MQAEKIIGIKYIGKMKTYDIEVDAPNHIFYGNGIATSNSHAYSYGYNAFYSAYCKTHNPVKFYEVYLNHARKKPKWQEEVNALVNDARIHNIETLPPNMCHFYKDFQRDGDKIYYGVSHIKDVGDKESEKLFDIIQNCDEDICNFSWIELLKLFDSVKKNSMVALISAGVLFSKTNKTSRTRMLYEFEQWKKITAREKEYIFSHINRNENLLYHINDLINNFKVNSNRIKTLLSIKMMLENTSYSLEDDPRWIAETETKYLGVFLSCCATDAGDVSLVDTTCKDICLKNAMGEVTIAGQLVSYRETAIKKKGKNQGKLMAFVSIQDDTAKLDSCVLFPDIYEKYKDLLFDNNTLMLSGKSDNGSLIVERLFQV